MQKENNTKKERRKLIHSSVYRTARIVRFALAKNEIYKPDELLCQTIAPALRELSSIALHKYPDSKILIHPHNDPRQVQDIIIESMHVAYDISERINGGKRVSKADRVKCEELFQNFDKIKLAVEKPAKSHTEPKPAPQLKRSSHVAGFDWPYFGVHYNDTLIVEENRQAPIGKLVLRKYEDGEEVLSRVCTVKGDIVRVTDDSTLTDEDDHSDIPLSYIIGPLSKFSTRDAYPPKSKPCAVRSPSWRAILMRGQTQPRFMSLRLKSSTLSIR